MKKLAVLMIAVSALLTGCVVYETPYQDRGHDRGQHSGQHDRDRDGVPDRMDRDRDGDGVRNRQDSRPNDPRRY